MDNTLVYRNIKAIAKSKHIEIGDLERSIGRSVGTFSRFSNNGFSIRLDEAFAVCQQLGITIDELISKDFAREIELEQIEREIEEYKKKICELKERVDGRNNG